MTARRPPTPAELAFVGERRFAVLATANAAGEPTAVPICHAVASHAGEPVVVSALDEKPKRVDARELARVRNIAARPEVALLVDERGEDWTRLAWVRLKGRGALVEPDAPGHAEAVAALRAKYPQYTGMAIETRPTIRVAGLTASSWCGDDRLAPGGFPRPQELASVVRGRRSVRAFEDRPVPRAAVERAIGAAGWAPSPHGRQPWRFAVVEAPARRAALAEAMAASWEAQLALDGQDAATIAARSAKSRDRLVTAPVLIIVCRYLADLDVYPDPDRQAAEATMATQSLGAAVQNLLLSLWADGLDAGWMCAPLFAPDVVRAALDLDPALEPQALIPVGHAAKDPVRRPRRPLDDLIVAWE